MSTSSECRCTTSRASVPAVDRPDCAASAGPFAYSEKGRGLSRRGTFHHRNSGIYDAQTRMASSIFGEPYLRSVFGFLGVTDATFPHRGGQRLNQGEGPEHILAPHLQAVQTHAQTFNRGHS